MVAVPLALLALAVTAQAHTAAFAPGMYCKGGNKVGVDDQNTNTVVNPMYQLSLKDFWFQHDRGCDQVPPPAGEFLELPAGGKVTVELAHNRAQTSLSYGGQYASDWPDGQSHPEDWNGNNVPGEGCIQDDGALHTSNQSTAAGTAFAISYNSKISDVTLENLVVFSVLAHTPWKRIAEYEIPADLPACPPEGCTCAWLWLPKGCGIPNEYMSGFKCKVTGAKSTAPVGVAKPPVFCGGDRSKCQAGPKQLIIWNQAEANNVFPPNGQSPGYNEVNGFFPGAQNDIFVKQAVPSVTLATVTKATSTAAPTTTKKPAPTTTTKPAPTTTTTKVVPTTTKAASTTTKVTPTTTKATSTPSSHCGKPRHRHHPRALGRFVEAVAD
ncbi:hypothetical protein F5X97DRAFT_312517, partial [Nemania serpens]